MKWMRIYNRGQCTSNINKIHCDNDGKTSKRWLHSYSDCVLFLFLFITSVLWIFFSFSFFLFLSSVSRFQYRFIHSPFFFYLIWFSRSTEFYSKVNKQRATMNKLLILKTTNTYLLRANCVRTFKPVCILYMCCHVLNVFVVVVGIFAVYILSN